MLKKNKNTFLLFYLLVAYILIQFVWWEVLLVKQTRQIHEEKKKILALGVSDPTRLNKELNELKKKEDNHIYMILGEGTIFLIFITIGIIRVYQAHKREKEIAQQQKNFLLSVSHELKTPLATARLNLQTMQKRELPKELQQQMISNTLNETERLTQLIENILISARLDDNNFNSDILLHKTKINLSELITDVITKNFSPAQLERIKLNLQQDVILQTDPIVFPSIIINLVENALKYSPAGEIVEVCLQKSNQIVFAVKDSGKGINTEEKKKIFDKFYRIGSEETRNSKGTGLGLFIVKRIVEMHGGTIEVKDNKPSGSIFEVYIPE